MNFKKFLGIITVFIFIMFTIMLISSYAWYTFKNGKTSFKATTNKNVEVNFATGNYINIEKGIPISKELAPDSEQVGRNSFNIDLNNSKAQDILLSVSITNIKIDKELITEDFKYELVYNNHTIKTGSFKELENEELTISKNILLTNNIKNEFEVRVYIEETNQNQNNLMNKSFQGKLNVNAIIRETSSPDFKITTIKKDGKTIKNIPTTGSYTVSSTTCPNQVEWDNTTNTLQIKPTNNTFPKTCDLEFTTIK